MARTLKDKHWKIRFRDWHEGYAGALKVAGYWPKTKKCIDTEYHWTQATPSCWNNLFHTRPIRGNFRNFSRNVVRSSMEAVQDMLEPSDSKSPHKYYW